MKFFDRKNELKLLSEIDARSYKTAQFTVLTGRRRIGKTSLILKAYENTPFMYFFVSRKTEKELCNDFKHEIEAKTDIPLPGATERFSELFEFVMKLACRQHITLFIDEFQDFFIVNPSIFSEIQRIWDIYKSEAKINLIVGGSIYSLMNRIFRDNKEPLFQRETSFIKLKAFPPSVLKDIMKEYYPAYSSEDLLALYTFTGGVAKYIELLIDREAYTIDRMLDVIVSEDSIFMDEGKLMLVGEFGKEFGTYFSILSAIAQGKTNRSTIENTVGKEIGGYLTRLCEDFELIGKRQPIFEKTSNKNVRYYLKDNFLSFWFRFVFKYNYMLEINAYSKLREIIERDYNVFSGMMLERYFREKLIESQDFTRIGSWWNRKGEDEIDIVAVNDLDAVAEFIEVKRNPEKINPAILNEKVVDFLSATKMCAGYQIIRRGLSLEDM